jgi:hypothetical protein
MGRILLILVALSFVACGCASVPDDETYLGTRDKIPDLALRMQTMLGSRWRVSWSTNRIEVSSCFKVYEFPVLGQHGGPFSKAEMDQYRTTFKIILTFTDSVPYSEVKMLRERRNSFADILNQGTKTKDEYGQAMEGYAETLVPEFCSEDATIYIDPGTSPFIVMSPEDKILECDVALVKIRRLLEDVGYNEYIK